MYTAKAKAKLFAPVLSKEAPSGSTACVDEPARAASLLNDYRNCNCAPMIIIITTRHKKVEKAKIKIREYVHIHHFLFAFNKAKPQLLHH
jgi:hypothetical protein